MKQKRLAVKKKEGRFINGKDGNDGERKRKRKERKREEKS